MTKTVSARIGNKDHQELLQRCNVVGCTVNEWINEAIQYLLTNYSEFNFGDEQELEENNITKVGKIEGKD